MTGKMVRRVIALALLAVACSNNKSLINEDDPFDDPFFSDGLSNGTRSLDEILREPSPSVGWLARDGATPPRSSRSGGGGITSGPDEEGVLLEAEGEATYDPEGGGYDDDDEASASRSEKSFYDQASEATLATMSILVGAGMAALPFLIGT